MKDERKKLYEIEKRQDKEHLLKLAELHDIEKARQRETEEAKRLVRGVEQQVLIDMKEKRRQEEKQRSFALDKIQVQQSIREAEEERLKDETKRAKLRAAQGQFVEASKRERAVKEQEVRMREESDY